MKLTSGLAFLIGLSVASWLASLDRAHWLDRYAISLQVERSTKGNMR
jgi:hypothetical protein